MKYVEVMTYLKDNGNKVCRYAMTKTRAENWRRKLLANSKINIVAMIGGEYKTLEAAYIGGFEFPKNYKAA